MILVASALTLIHVSFYIIMSLKWGKLPQLDWLESKATFTVVIPVRNEERNIRNILIDLNDQSFNRANFEVIVVDDCSEDNTVKVLQRVKSEVNYKLNIHSLGDSDLPGKKSALTKAIKNASNDIIITTDADCRVGKDWIMTYANCFTEDLNIVAGPVALEGNGVLASMQQVEFAGLMAFGAVTLSFNNPSMCSGANLAFRKKAFLAVGGYESNIHLASGDDEFLLYDVLKKFPESGFFLKSQEAIVKTEAHTSLRSFINQRSRWVGKWKYNKNWKLRLTAVVFFFDYLVFFGSGILTILGLIDPLFFPLIFGVRFAANYLFLKLSGNFLNLRTIFWPLIALQIFYPFHVLFMGVISIFGRYTWKGRIY